MGVVGVEEVARLLVNVEEVARWIVNAVERTTSALRASLRENLRHVGHASRAGGPDTQEPYYTYSYY